MVVPEARWRAGDPLGAPEKLMLECVAGGEVFDGADGLRSPELVALGAGEQRRTVRAEVLRHLLTRTDWPADPKGVRVRRLRIGGLLDLAGAVVRCPLWMEDCDLVDPR